MIFDIKSLNNRDPKRFSSYKANLDFYAGAQWRESSKYRQLVFNYARIAIDKVTSYLMNGLNFACSPLNNNGVIASDPSHVIERSVATKQSHDRGRLLRLARNDMVE